MNTGGETTKKRAPKKVTPVKQEERPKRKPAKKPTSPQEWLAKYLSQEELSTSSAKQVTFLLTRGATLEACIQRATEIGEMKGSKWGQSRGSIKSHISFLKGKGLKIDEKDGFFKIQG